MDFWACIPRTSALLELNNMPSSEHSPFQGNLRLFVQLGNGVAQKGLEIQAVHDRILSLKVQSGSLFGATPNANT